MILIANVDKNWSIGKDNKLLMSIPEDMKFFKDTTMGHTVVMGRKTLESLPGGRPLEGRTNIVLSRDASYTVNGADVVHGVEELQEIIKSAGDKEIYVIGGMSIYEALEPLCDLAYITRMDYSFDADAFFPKLDEMKEWKMIERSEEMTCFDIIYHRCTYRRDK